MTLRHTLEWRAGCLISKVHQSPGNRSFGAGGLVPTSLEAGVVEARERWLPVGTGADGELLSEDFAPPKDAFAYYFALFDVVEVVDSHGARTLSQQVPGARTRTYFCGGVRLSLDEIDRICDQETNRAVIYGQLRDYMRAVGWDDVVELREAGAIYGPAYYRFYPRDVILDPAESPAEA